MLTPVCCLLLPWLPCLVFFFCDEEKVLTLSPHRGGWIRRWGSRLLPISVLLLPLLAMYLVQICWAFCAFIADCHADNDVFPVDLIYCQRKRRFRRLLSSTRIIWTSCGKISISPFQRRLCSTSPSLMRRARVVVADVRRQRVPLHPASHQLGRTGASV